MRSSLQVDAQGFYRPCPECSAPIVQPFPLSWRLDMVKEGPHTGPVTTHLTPHDTSCTRPIEAPVPGTSIRLKGEWMKDITLGIATP